MEVCCCGPALPAASLASQCQLAMNERLLVVPAENHSLAVHYTDDLTRAPVVLKYSHVHRHAVTAMAMSDHHDLLCTTSHDMLAVWITPTDPSADIFEVHANPGSCFFMSVSENALHCCLCVGNDVLIFNIKDFRLEAKLQGHIAPVTCAQFYSSAPLVVVSVSEDRTFKVWDVENGCLLHQSAVLSGSPCISMALCQEDAFLATGFSNGKMMVFSMNAGRGYRCLHQSDIMKEAVASIKCAPSSTTGSLKEPKVISSTAAWKSTLSDTSSAHCQGDVSGEDIVSEGAYAILGLFFIKENNDGGALLPLAAPAITREVEISQKRLRSILTGNGKLLVCTSVSIHCISTNSWQVEGYVNLRSPITVPFDGSRQTDFVLPTPGSSYIVQNPSSEQIYCAMAGALLSSVSVLQLKLTGPGNCKDVEQKKTSGGESAVSILEGANHSEPEHNSFSTLTVLSSAPLSSSSVLRAPQLRLPAKSSPQESIAAGKKPPAASNRSKTGASLPLRSVVKDKPLTFKSTVKSSGYSTAPRAKMFTPQTKGATSKSVAVPSEKTRSSATRSHALETKAAYPLSAPCPIQIKTRLTVNQRRTPINNIVFSASGGMLACGMATKTINIVKSPLCDTSKIMTATGHDGSVVDLAWATQSPRLLSTACDRSVRLWNAQDPTDPLLVFDRQHHSVASSVLKGDTKTLGAADGNATFQKDVTHARFYYVDEFVVIVSGNTFGLYRYHINSEKPDDIRRYRTVNRYKLVKQFAHSTAQHITSMSCVNSFNSYIILLAGSDKSLDVYDMNVGKSARLLGDIHTRPAYRVCQNEGSTFITHSSPAYDLFLTSAVSDDIKLWDLRESKCVRRYHGHQQRAHQLGLAFSPCARFIAAASEDRSVYVYDIRQTAFLHRLSGHSDVVSDVTFNPKHPQLCCSTLDGKVSIYNDKM